MKNDYISEFKNLLDGRSIKASTVDKVFDAYFPSGKNITVDALRYLVDLPSLIGEDLALSYLWAVCRHRSLGWKSMASVVDLILTFSPTPVIVIDSIVTELNNRKIRHLSDGSPDNDGGDIISAIVYQSTNRNLDEGKFVSSKIGDKLAKEKPIVEVRRQIKNRLLSMQENSLNRKILEELLQIKTNDSDRIKNIARLLDETQCD